MILNVDFLYCGVNNHSNISKFNSVLYRVVFFVDILYHPIKRGVLNCLRRIFLKFDVSG